jgi:hypothetical protein
MRGATEIDGETVAPKSWSPLDDGGREAVPLEPESRCRTRDARA